MKNKNRLQVSSERFRIIYQEVKEGSEPGLRFYILVAVSTLIAALGLITNSTAVVIGAMLVAPLMTPIFGMTLALIRGNAELMGRSVRAEVAGVMASVCMGFILGYLSPIMEATPEMLSRTQPNLFDLLVAVLAGFAGSYAMVDEKISPALPGVAIATAIVPPLANCGLCFSLGAYEGAIGSFLLFFANFLSILLVASVTFTVFGLARNFETISKKEIFKRFGLAGVSFLFVTVFLTHALFKIVHEKQTELKIHSVLSEMVFAKPSSSLDKMKYDEEDGKLYVKANVHSSKIISPMRVKAMEERLSEETDMPVTLIVSSVLARDISAKGSNGRLIQENLDGLFFDNQPQPMVQMTTTAERLIRDYLASRYGMNLLNVDIIDFDNALAVIATISCIRNIENDEVREIERLLVKGLDKKQLKLIVRQAKLDMITRDGSVRYEWFPMEHQLSEVQRADIKKARVFLENQFESSEDYFLVNINSSVIDDRHYFLLEITGKRYFPSQETAEIQHRVSELIGKPVQIYVWSKPEIVATADGYTSYEATAREIFSHRKETYKKTIEKLIKSSGNL